MMNRRHQIVHRADRNAHPGSGHHRASSIGRPAVTNWIDAVSEFVHDVLEQISD
jgi:hypothetical protein